MLGPSLPNSIRLSAGAGGQACSYEPEDKEKKSKERREKDRKALRLRRINSLKRQIAMKEAALEVSGTYRPQSTNVSLLFALPPPPWTAVNNVSKHFYLLTPYIDLAKKQTNTCCISATG